VAVYRIAGRQLEQIGYRPGKSLSLDGKIEGQMGCIGCLSG